jgi:Tfp pilus assembly protein PilF
LRKSLEIHPAQTGSHEVLAVLYRLEGDRAAEAEHRQASLRIRRFLEGLEADEELSARD